MTTLNGVLKAVGSPAIGMADVAGVVGDALRGAPSDERRFLVLVPDSTRKAPVAEVFRAIHDAVDGRADRVDAMIAQGTHGPMSEAEKSAWVFGGDRYPGSTVFDHAWDDPNALTPLGVVPLDDQLDRFGENREFAPLLGFDSDMRIRVNAKLLEYDRLVLLTRVQPHEVAGFAGGAKQIFPGVSGPEMISLLHAIGSLRTNRGIHGVMPNPVRDLIDDMALNLPNPITTIGLVIDDDSDAIHGAFVQPDGWRECVEQAAALSAAVNIRYVPRRVRRVVAALPQRKDGSWLYPDLWTGAKGVLKTEDAVADGGELVVWAPNIDSISDAHGELISTIGYHTYAYFLSHPESWQRANATPLALNGSALMKGEGRMAAGREVPRIDVRIATAIPADECARMNIGYEDPDAVAAEIAATPPNAITDDRLIVHDAGGVLWRYRAG